MFKFLVLFAVLATALAKPAYIASPYGLATPYVATYPAAGTVYPASPLVAAPIAHTYHTIAKRDVTPLAYTSYPAYSPVVNPVYSAYSGYPHVVSPITSVW